MQLKSKHIFDNAGYLRIENAVLTLNVIRASLVKLGSRSECCPTFGLYKGRLVIEVVNQRPEFDTKRLSHRFSFHYICCGIIGRFGIRWCACCSLSVYSCPLDVQVCFPFADQLMRLLWLNSD